MSVETCLPRGKRRRFKPWENLRRLFQRKNSRSDSLESGNRQSVQGQGSKLLSGVFGLATSRSRSTSELLTTEPQPIPGTNFSSRGVAPGVYSSGLSVSHDSVFGVEASTESFPHQSPIGLESLASSNSLQYLKELRAAIGRRRSAEEDEGLPHSPITVSPTTAEIISANFSGNPVHHHHSTGGSDPSLLSMDSCDIMEEMPFVSLHNTVKSTPNVNRSSSNNQNYFDGDELPVIDEAGLIESKVPMLTNSAAQHKMAVRPRKNHSSARPRYLPQVNISE